MYFSFPKVLLAGAFFLGLSFPAKAAELTYRIPLYIFNSSTTTGSKEYKVGIRLKIGAVSSGRETPWRMYEFDTGGTGFFAFPYSTTQTENVDGNYTLNYASGNMLTGNRKDTRITFEGKVLGVSPSVGANIVLISGASSPTAGDTLNSWQTELPNTPPLEVFFYGDFGMSLGELLPTTSGFRKPSLYAILPQLALPGSGGFIIHLGDKPKDDAPQGKYGEIGQGWIQIGLTKQQRKTSSWTSAVAMVPKSGKRYPGSRLPLYTEILSSGTLHLTGLEPPQATGIVYDTGAPNTKIHTVGTGTSLQTEITNILNEDNVTLKLDGDPKNPPQSSEILDFEVGNSSGEDEAAVSTTNTVNSRTLYVNTGITAFFGNDVVFNLENGFVGFRSSSTSSSSDQE